MKKYFIVSIISNIIISLLGFYGLMHYLAYSTSNSISSTIDLIVLIGVVIVDILINLFIYKLLRINIKKIYILIPSSISIIIIGCLFMFIG